MIIKKLDFVVLTFFILAACQSTDNKEVEETNAIQIKNYTHELVDGGNLPNISIPEVPLKKQALAESIAPFKESDNFITKQGDDRKYHSLLLNKQVCKDNVKVTYNIIDQNAVSGTYHAELQVQSIIIAVSPDDKKIKLRTTGWYSKSANLNKWAPYLKKPPIAKGILLKAGSEYWHSIDNWYLCGGGSM